METPEMCKHLTWLEKLASDKHSGLLAHSDEGEKLCDTDTRCDHCHEQRV